MADAPGAASDPYNPFIRLTHLFSEDGRHHSGPLFIKPERILEVLNGKVYVEGGGSYVVSEKAEQIIALVLAKAAENREAETLGRK